MAKLEIEKMENWNKDELYTNIIEALSDNKRIYTKTVEILLKEKYDKEKHYIVVKTNIINYGEGKPKKTRARWVLLKDQYISQQNELEIGKIVNPKEYEDRTYPIISKELAENIYCIINMKKTSPVPGTVPVEGEVVERENGMIEFSLEEIKEAYRIAKAHVENNMNSKLKKNDNFRQVIFTGAPGTGKTYGILEYVKNECGDNEDRYKFIQFHSSYDYSDFVEGLRPIQMGEKQEMTFVRMDGIFKGFCRKVVEANLKAIKQKCPYIDSINELYKLMQNETEDKKEDKKIVLNEINKTKYYFIIDEINRADIGRVFGELMFCLEESYRGVVNRIPTQYSNLKTYNIEKKRFYGETGQPEDEDVFKEGFFIPENVHIIGSMNDIDRSVESFDFALRRRFKWIDIEANEVMEDALRDMFIQRGIGLEGLNNICNIITKLNNVISGQGENEGGKLGLNKAYHIGPAYFKEYNPHNDRESRKDIWETRIESILREYVRGRKSEYVEGFINNAKKAFLVDKSEN